MTPCNLSMRCAQMAASCSGFVSSGVSGKSISWLEKKTVCRDYIKETPLQNAPLSELAPPRFKSKIPIRLPWLNVKLRTSTLRTSTRKREGSKGQATVERSSRFYGVFHRILGRRKTPIGSGPTPNLTTKTMKKTIGLEKCIRSGFFFGIP